MKIYRKPNAFGYTLAIFLACYLYLPSVSAGIFTGTEWKVTSGDTLYAICRAIFPGNARKQAGLGRDIKKLNPSVFKHGVNNMNVGVVLKLPDYVASKSAPSTVGTPKPGALGGTEWRVKRDDTLYMICRTIYPGDARKQAQLGRDIKKLNPSIFANGANNMNVGVILKLPEYVAAKSVPSTAGELAPALKPEKATPVTKPRTVITAPVAEPKPEIPEAKGQSAFSPSRSKGGVVAGLGFSYGGDKLVDVGNGPDIFAGNGIQLRLGYEQMFQYGSGYRASLGLQYYTLLEQRDVSYRDIYLQLAYQYQANPVVYGIGVVLDAGAMLDTNATTEFDPAVGAVVYLEYVGSGILTGWGLSATSLEIKEKNSGTSVDASRAELYYSWRF